ncbi:hypothetical protein D917_10587, partial [Trichinella nativa]
FKEEKQNSHYFSACHHDSGFPECLNYWADYRNDMHVRQAVKSQSWDANKNKPHFSNGASSITPACAPKLYPVYQ